MGDGTFDLFEFVSCSDILDLLVSKEIRKLQRQENAKDVANHNVFVFQCRLSLVMHVSLLQVTFRPMKSINFLNGIRCTHKFGTSSLWTNLHVFGKLLGDPTKGKK